MAFVALFDTDALWPIWTTDLLLRAAEKDLYRPVWTARILDSLARYMKEKYNRLAPEKIDHRIAEMRKYFPDAEVEGYEALIPVMTNVEHDRHVLAAAVRAHAAVIVTQNTKHFPLDACSPYSIDVQTLDDFLCHLWHLKPKTMASLLRQQAADLSSPKLTVVDIISKLQKQVPRFAETAWISGQFD
jgi:hypothetical protein